MDEARKKSIADALGRYLDKVNGVKSTGRKNEKPEKLVEVEVIAWMKAMGWKYNIIESKAVYSQKLGRYMHSQARKGHADITGITDTGIGFAVELKAKGKRSTLREDQREFLLDYIERGGFACCTDNVDHLETLWNNYMVSNDKKTLLISDLPKERQEKTKPLFD